MRREAHARLSIVSKNSTSKSSESNETESSDNNTINMCNNTGDAGRREVDGVPATDQLDLRQGARPKCHGMRLSD